MAAKTLILVIGCHRSGTSAVAGSLARMGVAVPGELIPPAFDNPKGFYEDRRVVAFHDKLLANLGASWDKPPSRVSVVEKDTLEFISAFLLTLPVGVSLVKDPRASLFVALWAKACETEGIRLCVLEVRRDRRAIAESLAAREGWEEKRARRLADEYTARIDATRKRHIGPWASILFPSELEDEKSWERIFEAFDFRTKPDLSAVRGFVDRRLIHHGEGDIPPLWSVVIPSRDDQKVLDCVAGLIATHPAIRADQIAIVSDGLSLLTRWRLRGLTWVNGARPFNFSRAVNTGVAATHPDSDIVILGDDVQLATPRAIDRLASACDGAAAIAPEVVGVCGQPAQRAGSGMSEAEWLAFICAYIPRYAWNVVGPLDERFIGYGYDDVDWCKRARKELTTFGAPPRLKIAHDVRAIHLQDSSYRSRDDWRERYAQNRKIYEEKWRAA